MNEQNPTCMSYRTAAAETWRVEVHLFVDSERPRGQYSFTKTNNKLYVSYTVNEARACLWSKELHSTRQGKQHGHAAAASQVKQMQNMKQQATL